MEKQPMRTEDRWSAYSGEPMERHLGLPRGGAFELCPPCFVFLAQSGSHIPAVPPAPFLGWWQGSIGEAGKLWETREEERSGGAPLARTCMSANLRRRQPSRNQCREEQTTKINLGKTIKGR